MSENAQARKKICFVTIGATATFDALITACTQPDFLCALHREGYTDLLVQYGNNRKLWKEAVAANDSLDRHGVEVSGFSFRESGITAQMQLAKGDPRDGSQEGVIISHAGTATAYQKPFDTSTDTHASLQAPALSLTLCASMCL